jgi:8-oxo-dGTP pyrophosphatase MutT (NUDIX family)
MERISIGYLFSVCRNYIAVIHQNFDNDKIKGVFLNGPVGHIEKDESSKDAVRREFREETGVDIEDWKLVCNLYSSNLQVDFYKSFSDKVFDVKTIEDEMVSVYNIGQLQFLPCHPNMQIIIGMCMDDNLKVGTLIYS